jgi:uncharacterized protein (TIGR03435 family)
MKRTPEYIKGPKAWTRFETAMKHVGTVPHAEIQRRIEAERQASTLKPVRFLELAKSGVTGPDLHPSPPGDCGKMPNAQAVPPPTPGAPAGANPCGGIGISSGRFNGHRTNMEELATDLSLILGRPVFDKTGLTGSFDLTLTWTPDQSASDSPGPSIYTALQEQLGLTVETGRGPVEMIVVNSVEKATVN